MKAPEKHENLITKAAIPTLDPFPQAQKRVVEVVNLSHDLDISSWDLLVLNRKFHVLMAAIRLCLWTPESLRDLSALFTKTLRDLGGKEKVKAIYGLTPLDLRKFTQLPLVSQFVYLFAQDRDENMPNAVCHHWTIFWYNFWKEARAWTIFADEPIRLCQRTNNLPDICYNLHSFVLVGLEKRYIISADWISGIQMKEAVNFSELEKQVYRTVRSVDKVTIEKIHTYKSARTFARKLEQVPDKEIQLALMILRWADQKV